MPLEGHGTDCDCGCCDIEEEPQIKTQTKYVCPACGKEMAGTADTACTACATMKCPACGATMQTGA
jgi:predicted RNA-binding Zn-ribbon protein involved in translation (DUF1610 family)